MKNLRSYLFGLLLAVSGTAHADEYAYLTIDQTGNETSFAVSSINRITFSNTDMVLHMNDGTQQTLPLASLSKMFFAENGTNGIAATIGAEQRITLKDGVLRVKGLPGQTVSVYNTGGQIVRKVTAGEQETEVNLSGMVKGVYIVRVGNETKKIMNK